MNSSSENTLRVLKGEQPVQRLRCRMGFHRWTQWEHIDGTINPMTFDGYREHIRCQCADCGLLRVEKPYSKTLK